MSAIPAGTIMALISSLAGLLVGKKKKFILWYRGLDEKWTEKTKPLSYRQCRKTRTTLVKTGPYLFARFAIFREGTKP